MENPVYNKPKNPIYDTTRAITIIMEEERNKTRTVVYQAVKITVISCIISTIIYALTLGILHEIVYAITLPVCTLLYGYFLTKRLITECGVNDINFMLNGSGTGYVINEEDAFDIIRKLCERRGFAKGHVRSMFRFHIVCTIYMLIFILQHFTM